jgi:hemerythrin-like metal-binding protein
MTRRPVRASKAVFRRRMGDSMHNAYAIPQSLSIDYDDINAEHEELVSILNTALELVRTTAGVGAHALDGPLTRLRAALGDHFEHEEREMAELKYDDLDRHKAHHALCAARLDEICRSFATTRVDKAALDEIFDMILDDIIRADSGFKSFLYARNILH